MSTFSQLKSNCSKELGLDETASGDEDVLLGRRLNQAVREFLVDTRCYIKAATFTAVSGTGDYDFQSTTTYITLAGAGAPESGKVILAIDSIYDSANIPLERVSVSEIEECRRGSVAAASYRRKYAMDGANLFMLWPTPTSNEAFSMRLVPRPTEMSSASHDPSDPTYGGIPAEYHEALEFWANWRIASYDDDTSSGQGDRYLGQYQMMVNRAQASINLKAGRKIGPVRLRKGRVRVPSNPSQDIWY